MPQSENYNGLNSRGNNSKFILIGEDDIDDQDLLKEVFSSVDDSFALLFAINGTELLQLLESKRDEDLPCLIVLDYNMPGINGADILKEIKQLGRYEKIPKIIWSTSGSPTYKDLCLQLGANDYLVKPSNVRELTEICRHMISTCTT